jgi:hypothetical protein
VSTGGKGREGGLVGRRVVTGGRGRGRGCSVRGRRACEDGGRARSCRGGEVEEGAGFKVVKQEVACVGGGNKQAINAQPQSPAGRCSRETKIVLDELRVVSVVLLSRCFRSSIHTAKKWNQFVYIKAS